MLVTFWIYLNFSKQGKGAEVKIKYMRSGVARSTTRRVASLLAGFALAELTRVLAVTSKRVAVLCLIVSCSATLAYANLPSYQGKDALQPQPKTSFVRDKQTSVGHNLRRLDFRIKGKSCAVCLIGIENRLKDAAGVLKVAVMLKNPYGASVIYDAKKTTEKNILRVAQNNDKSISLLAVKDTHLSKFPVVLIPPIN